MRIYVLNTCIYDIETKVYNTECNFVFVVVFLFCRSFLRYLNITVQNLFYNILNYISENLPLSVEHFCDPNTAK